jgi:predicted ATP-dependent serine protease
LRRLGFKRAVVPASSPEGPYGMQLIRVETVAQAMMLVG